MSRISRPRVPTGEGAGFIDLWWVKQSLVWCWKNVHGVRQIVKEPYLTPKCKGRDWGITNAGIGWTWQGWEGCRNAGGAGYTYVKRWNQGHFRPWGGVQTAKPSAWVKSYAGGASDEGGGGN